MESGVRICDSVTGEEVAFLPNATTADVERARARCADLTPQMSGYQVIGIQGLLDGSLPTTAQLEAWFRERGVDVVVRTYVAVEGAAEFSIYPLRLVAAG